MSLEARYSDYPIFYDGTPNINTFRMGSMYMAENNMLPRLLHKGKIYTSLDKDQRMSKLAEGIMERMDFQQIYDKYSSADGMQTYRLKPVWMTYTAAPNGKNSANVTMKIKSKLFPLSSSSVPQSDYNTAPFVRNTFKYHLVKLFIDDIQNFDGVRIIDVNEYKAGVI